MSKIIDLSGIWNFSFQEGVTVANCNPTAPTPDWMAIPGSFDARNDLQGRRGCGLYQRYVATGGRVKLQLDGYGLHCRIWWDGREIHRGDLPYSRTEITFDAGAPLPHLLTLAVDNIIDRNNASLFREFYDFYGWGGLYRPLNLTELPQYYIDSCAITTTNYQTGQIKVKLELQGDFPDEISSQLYYRGQVLATLPVRQGRAEVICQLPQFELWSPAAPHLETLRVEIPTETRSYEFGVRQIAWQDAQITLNGEPLKLIGYNRHDAHPEFGPALPTALRLQDLQMIRQQGANFIRGCHYPQSEEVLTLCDKLGLLVWEEALGWGNSRESLLNSTFQKRQLEQTKLMVRKSINHPCVIMWGMLNEAATQYAESRALIGQLVELCHQCDDSRPVTLGSNQGVQDKCLDLLDIISFNTYPGWYTGQDDNQFFVPEAVTQELATLEKFAEKYHKPLLISEIGAEAIPGDHSQLRWSEEFQADLLCCTVDYILHSAHYQGVALWQFCDGRTYCGTTAQFRSGRMNRKGVVDEYRRPKLAWRELTRLLKKSSPSLIF